MEVFLGFSLCLFSFWRWSFSNFFRRCAQFLTRIAPTSPCFPACPLKSFLLAFAFFGIKYPPPPPFFEVLVLKRPFIVGALERVCSFSLFDDFPQMFILFLLSALNCIVFFFLTPCWPSSGWFFFLPSLNSFPRPSPVLVSNFHRVFF